MINLISVDPGKEKCGIVLVDKESGVVLEGRVVHASALISTIIEFKNNFSIEFVLLGNGTTSDFWESEIKNKCLIETKLFEEKNTTLRARYRYWELWPKNKLLNLIPSGLIIPNENLDAVSALILIEDFLDMKFTWPNNKNFKI